MRSPARGSGADIRFVDFIPSHGGLMSGLVEHHPVLEPCVPPPLLPPPTSPAASRRLVQLRLRGARAARPHPANTLPVPPTAAPWHHSVQPLPWPCCGGIIDGEVAARDARQSSCNWDGIHEKTRRWDCDGRSLFRRRFLQNSEFCLAWISTDGSVLEKPRNTIRFDLVRSFHRAELLKPC